MIGKMLTIERERECVWFVYDIEALYMKKTFVEGKC